MHWQKPIIKREDREREKVNVCERDRPKQREFECSSLHRKWVTACSPVIDSILCGRLLYILSITITQEVTYVLVTTGNQYTSRTTIIGKQKCKKCFVLNISHDSSYHDGLICKKYIPWSFHMKIILKLWLFELIQLINVYYYQYSPLIRIMWSLNLS